MPPPPDLSIEESTAAFESFLEQTEDEFRDTDPNSDDSETLDDDDNSSDDNENTDLDEDDEELEDDEETEDDEDDDEGSDDSDESDDESDSTIDSIEALAEHFDVEPDQVLENLMVDDIDGEPIAIGEALESWRESEGTYSARSEELETTFTTRREELEGNVNQQVVTLQGLARGMIDTLRRDFSPERLAEVRMENPEQYADLIDRRNQINELIQGAINAGDSIGNERAEASQESVDKLLQKENTLLLKAKPEWRSDKARQKAWKQHQLYLTKHVKFSPDEIDAITDHRILVLIDDAVLGRRVRSGSAKKNIKVLKKRGLKRPSTGLKSSSRREPVNSRNKARTSNMARLKKSGKAEDSVALFMEHIED